MIDSILLIDTFFVLFRSSRGRYAGLIVPQDLFWKRVCQIVVNSLRKSRKLAFRLQLELFFRKSSRGLGVVWAPIAICVGYSVVDFVCVHSALCGAFFGARCAFLGSFLVRDAPFLGSILVRGGGAPFWADFGTVRLFGFDFGALPFRDRFWYVVRWCWGRSQPAGNKIYQDWRGPGGNRARDLSNMGPWSWRMMPFRVDDGARCAFSGSVLVCGAPFLGWILVRGAPFLGWILVRGMWCADFGADFGARCVVFGLDFGARCAVFGLDFGALCVVRRFWAPISVHGASFFGSRCAVFGLEFGARYVVRRFWGRFRCTVRRFWARFWCAVRRFWAGFWCAVCGAPILGPISVHGASFLGSLLVRGAPFLGSILVRGVWCADFGADFVARCAFLGSILARCAPFLGSILVRGALRLGSVTASGQQDLSRLERTWGESSPRPVEYGALVLAHDALSGGFWCEVHLFGLGFGVRCVVFGLAFGARCAVFGLDFGARCVVRRFWAPISVHGAPCWARFWCAVRLFWARFWCAVCGARPFWVRFWCVALLCSILVRRALMLGPILVHGALFWIRFGFWRWFWCTVRFFCWVCFWCTVCDAPILGSIFAHGVPLWAQF